MRKSTNNDNSLLVIIVTGERIGKVGVRNIVSINISSVILNHNPTPRAWCIYQDFQIDAIRMISSKWVLLEDNSKIQYLALIWVLNYDEFLLPQYNNTALRPNQRFIPTMLYCALYGWEFLIRQKYILGMSNSHWNRVLCTEKSGIKQHKHNRIGDEL